MHVFELELSPAALACLRAANIFFVDELLGESGDALLSHGVGPNELYEIACRLAERNMGLAATTRLGRCVRKATERDLAMLHMRLVEGLTLDEVAERMSVSQELVRRLVREAFGITGNIATVKARKWAATQRRRMEPEGPS